MNRTERLQEVLRLDGIAAAARNRAQEHRAALTDDARAELEREGSAPTWRVSDIGTITLPVSKEEPFVFNETAFLAWCKERHPDQIEHIERVRGAFQASLLAGAFIEEGDVVDGQSGEILPGVAVRPGGQPRSLTIRATPEARAVFDAIGARMLDDLLAGSAEPVGHLEVAEVTQ
jgi:hypothetical protein